MGDGLLHKYFLSNGDKRLHKWIHYFDIYERHFERFRGTSPIVLEMGVFGGGSLAMWKEYFGPGAQIVGLDIVPACKEYEAEGIEIFIGSQDDPSLLNAILEKYPQPNIILDDASHIQRHMIASFQHLYEKMHPRGVYMVEDTHTSYMHQDYEGGLRREGTFMEFVKGKLDEINAVWTNGEMPVSTFTRSTACIACYDSVVAFERQPQGQRQAPITIAL